MKKPLLLIVDDRRDIRTYCDRFLAQDYSYVHVRNGKEALKRMADDRVSLVLLDKSFKDVEPEGLLGPPEDYRNEGLRILEQLRKDYPDLPIIMVTAHGDRESAREAVLLGASDYVEWGEMAVDKCLLRMRIECAIGRLSES